MRMSSFSLRSCSALAWSTSLLFLGAQPTCSSQEKDIEFVESIPLETSLDNPDIRNTQVVWLELIRSAHQSLDIEQFYIANKSEEVLDTVLQAIRSAAERGVAVRILAEEKFYKTYPDALDKLDSVANITVRIIRFSAITGGGVQHAKYFIVDGEKVFLGSQNFDWRSLSHIHELGLAISNRDIALAFSTVFEMDWQYASDGQMHTPNRNIHSANFKSVYVSTGLSEPDALVRAVFSPRDFIPSSALWDEAELAALIDSAKEIVEVQLLSYSRKGDDMLDQSMRRAALRGVQVRLLVSNWSLGKNKIDDLRSLQKQKNITVRFSDIPEFSGGFISFARVEHCKYMVVDGKHFWLGTNNWARDYFYESRNLGVIVRSDSMSNRLHRIFMKSWDAPYAHAIDPALSYRPPRTSDASGK